MKSVAWQVRKKLIGLTTALICLAALHAHADPVTDNNLERGKQLVMARAKGNCLACHAIADGELPGNLGPPLMAMRLRFPDEAVLREQIRDATQRNPNSRMPPFGKHGILTEEEIGIIVEYLYSL